MNLNNDLDKIFAGHAKMWKY